MSEILKNKSWSITNLKNTKGIALILIIAGISIRLFMLIFYYIVNSGTIIAWGGWGDVGLNFHDVDTIFTGEWKWNPGELVYPPLSVYFLLFLRIVSFDIIEIYVFYVFLLELLVTISFYFVLKKWAIPNSNLVFGLFIANPFVFLNYVFSASNCGYHATDSFFLLFLMIALYYYPDENKSKFYLFCGLAMCAKWFTLPAAPFFFFKYLFKEDWEEIKKIFIFIGIPIAIFLISPIFYLPNYLDLYSNWLSNSGVKEMKNIPLYIKIIPFITLFALYFLFRLKKADLLEITFFSIILMFAIMFWSRPYVRFLTPLVLYGHLMVKEDIFTLDINVKIIQINIQIDNNLLTFALSVLGCIVAIAIIIFVLS